MGVVDNDPGIQIALSKHRGVLLPVLASAVNKDLLAILGVVGTRIVDLEEIQGHLEVGFLHFSGQLEHDTSTANRFMACCAIMNRCFVLHTVLEHEVGLVAKQLERHEAQIRVDKHLKPARGALIGHPRPLNR